jgi:hypothetical protein
MVPTFKQGQKKKRHILTWHMKRQHTEVCGHIKKKVLQKPSSFSKIKKQNYDKSVKTLFNLKRFKNKKNLT